MRNAGLQIPHPSTNPSCFLAKGCPSVYDVEEKLLSLSERGKWLKVKIMEFNFGISVEKVLRNRVRYYKQFAPKED